jgi:hypothetical protein
MEPASHCKPARGLYICLAGRLFAGTPKEEPGAAKAKEMAGTRLW